MLAVLARRERRSAISRAMDTCSPTIEKRVVMIQMLGILDCVRSDMREQSEAIALGVDRARS